MRTTDSFPAAIVGAIELGGDTDTVAAVAGGLAGAVHGIQGIPSRWATYVHGRVTTADGVREYDATDLQDVALRLVGSQPAPMAPLGPGAGPTEIAPRLWAADLAVAATTPPDHAVISLCRTGGALDDRPIRRSVFLIGQAGANPDLPIVVDDVVRSIDAFHAEGRDVVVHCHHGQSRTGLVLRAWLMRHHGWDEPTATSHVAERWHHLALHNPDFTAALRA